MSPFSYATLTVALAVAFAAVVAPAASLATGNEAQSEKSGAQTVPSNPKFSNLTLVPDGGCGGGSFWAIRNSDQSHAYNVTLRVDSRPNPENAYPQFQRVFVPPGGQTDVGCDAGIQQHFYYSITGAQPARARDP
jgi:hypothetical protein